MGTSVRQSSVRRVLRGGELCGHLPAKQLGTNPYLLHQRDVVIANHAIATDAAKLKHGQIQKKETTARQRRERCFLR